MRNRVKELLVSGEPALGAWISILDGGAVRATANSGVDWILFDTEHGPPSIETVDGLIHGMGDAEALPFVRVVWNDVNAIKRALDTGAYGVVVPWVSSKEDAEKAVRYTKYPPEGVRGCAPGRAARAWGISTDKYLKNANDEIMVIVQIERREAVENIHEIISVEGVDATFIGPSDLSASMGLIGQPWHPRVVEAINKVCEACMESEVSPGIAYTKGVEHTRKLIAQGFQLIGVGGDAGFLTRGGKQTTEAIKA